METNRFFKKITTGFLSFYLSLALVFPPLVFAEQQDVIDTKTANNVFLYIGDLVTLKVGELTRVALANPGIVDITNATAEEITLVGRKVGETQIFIWDQDGKRQIVARVLGTDLDRISQRIASLFQSSRITTITLEKNYYEGKIVLGGYVSKGEQKKLDEILKGFDDVLINMVVEEGDMIQIDVQFSELNTTLSKALGFDWTSALDFAEALPSQDGSFADLFKLGDFSRTTAILSTVNFLIQEGKARVLSKPSLVVANGEDASFLVGGEIPIRTTTTASSGSSQENVTFKDYGVELSVTPEIRDGKIDIKVEVTVRDVDASSVGNDDVAFLTRTATTKVRLIDGQTIVLAGMIQRRQSESTKRVPFISKIPVVGLLFQNKSNPAADNDQELVVSLTPRILKNLPQSTHDPKLMEDNKKPASLEEAKAAVTQETEIVPAENTIPPKTEEAKAVTIEAPPTAIPPAAVAVALKTPAQIKAEKIAAGKKAKADAKAAAAKAKKDKIKKAKFEKEEKARAAKEAKANKRNKRKTIETSKAVSPNDSLAEKMSADVSLSATARADDPSLNMSLDDPRISDPQNVLSDDEIAKVKDKYISKIKDEMAETISYPYEAKASRWEGTAVLKITITPDGNVKDVAVSQSSGYAVFDKDAINTAEILAPFDRFAPAKNMREIIISVPVEYSEKAILGGATP